jgi:BMFP domain-containing protein YqiC
MIGRTRERIEWVENRLTALEQSGGHRLADIDARITALEDSLQAAELQIEERKAENKYLNSLLVMLQSGVDARKGPTV